MRLQNRTISALALRCRPFALSILAAVVAAPIGTAGQGDPGSLLIYPQFDSRPGRVSIISITNTSGADEVDVEFVYVGRAAGVDSCNEFNRVHTLTPNDTYSAVVMAHNPVQIEGFVYAVAKSTSTFNVPVTHNHLLGSILVVDGLALHSYDVEALPFEGLAKRGGTTDANGNGRRDLDGIEYAPAPDELLVPRFLGQSETESAELILVNLTLTIQADITTGFLLFNDNEEAFSATHTFNCWTRVALGDVTGIFSNTFLASNTNHDPDEIVGATGQEAGWFRIDGLAGVTGAGPFDDPTILAVLIESTADTGTTATLPFEYGERTTGSLIQTGDSLIAPARRRR